VLWSYMPPFRRSFPPPAVRIPNIQGGEMIETLSMSLEKGNNLSLPTPKASKEHMGVPCSKGTYPKSLHRMTGNNFPNEPPTSLQVQHLADS
jgi:hypothetical protein